MVPSQQCAWLGFEVDLHRGVLSVPQEKIKALKTQLEQMALRPRLPAKVLASLAGKIVAMSIALGPVARLMTRGLHFGRLRFISTCIWHKYKDMTAI